MTANELRRLGRKELLELLIEEEKENEALREQLAQLQAKLEERSLQVSSAGSLAEAALSLNGVFESADRAVAQYVENIKRMSEESQTVYEKTVFDAQCKAKAIVDKAEEEKQQKMEAADAYWANLSTRLETFYRDHRGLQELMAAVPGPSTEESHG